MEKRRAPWDLDVPRCSTAWTTFWRRSSEYAFISLRGTIYPI
jgi:hypothetical protein